VTAASTDKPAEVTERSARLTKCGIEIDECRAWWAHADQTGGATLQQIFDEYWFGAKSLDRIKVLVRSLRLRFDAFSAAHATLHRWPHMCAETRRLLCHWHLQLSDPLYRAFTGEYLPTRRLMPLSDVTRAMVVDWVGRETGTAWTLPTRTQFATNALSAACASGIVVGKRDPRAVTVPVVPNDALGYLLHLLREVEFSGTLLANPYLASVGLIGGALDDRLRSLPGIRFRRQGELADFGWEYDSLAAWHRAVIGSAPDPARAAGGAA
jgi:hypothetical protein